VTSNPAVEGAGGLEVSVTIKGAGGYSDPWVVTRGTPQEVDDYTASQEYKALLDRVYGKIGPAYAGAGSAPQQSSNSGGGGNTQKRSNAPRGAQEPPAYAPPCPGEGWQYKSGKKKNGQGTWEAWMPPKGSNADPVWFSED
jgi:hypothetical protein